MKQTKLKIGQPIESKEIEFEEIEEMIKKGGTDFTAPDFKFYEVPNKLNQLIRNQKKLIQEVNKLKENK